MPHRIESSTRASPPRCAIPNVGSHKPFLCARVGGLCVAFEADLVCRVYPAGALRCSSHEPWLFIAGTALWWGIPVPVVDLRTLLCQAGRAGQASPVIAIVRHGDLATGVVVDEAIDVCTMAAADIDPPPADIEDPWGYVVGTVAQHDNVIGVIDLPAILRALEPALRPMRWA